MKNKTNKNQTTKNLEMVVGIICLMIAASLFVYGMYQFLNTNSLTVLN